LFSASLGKEHRDENASAPAAQWEGSRVCTKQGVLLYVSHETTPGWWLNHPSEKYESNWIISPSRGQNKKNETS